MMKGASQRAFAAARERFRKLTEELTATLPELPAAQEELIRSRRGPAYTLDTPVVYNRALDETEPPAEIKLILVADNPGRREQAAENRRYLVGPSGKLAEKFFREHPGLGIDFRKNVIILNKTPIHTPRTAELRELRRLGGPAVAEALAKSQRAMVLILGEFRRALAPVPVWITGYSEMKRGGVFEVFTEALGDLRRSIPAPDSPEEGIFLYRHFSMNQFTINLAQETRPRETTAQTLARLGAARRKQILGW
jgi:uracil-DNA glycosylase